MAEYIERESVHELIERLEKYQMFNYDRSQSIVGISPDDVNFGVDKIPSADVAPVRHGRWIDGEKNPVPWDEYNPNCPLYSAYCSECGKWLVGSDEYPASGLYCPNCGCLMLGGDRDDKFCSYGQRKEADHEVSEP